MSKIKKFFTYLSELVFPSTFKCIFCNCELSEKTLSSTCEECEKKLPFVSGKTCKRCGDKIDSMADYCMICKDSVRHFALAVAPFVYKNQISDKIKKFKFENERFLFAPLSCYMAKCYEENQLNADIIVSVPMTEEKEKQRGYNQASELAKFLSTSLGLPVELKSLKKIKNTSRQVDLAFEERSKNMKDAFWVADKNTFKNKTVLLIDDVFTTGATCEECSKALKKGGAQKVIVLTLARTHIEKQVPFEE